MQVQCALKTANKANSGEIVVSVRLSQLRMAHDRTKQRENGKSSCFVLRIIKLRPRFESFTGK